MAAAKEADCTYDENHYDSNSNSNQTIPPTIYWNDNKGSQYDNEYDNDDIEYDFENDNEDDEYDRDHQMYNKNDTIKNRISEDTSYIENTTIHPDNINDMNITTNIPTVTPTTDTIIESSDTQQLKRYTWRFRKHIN